MSIFISYISEEVSISKVLKKSIENTFGEKHKVFVSGETTDLLPGSRWIERIESAIKDAKIIIVLCSPESIKRPWISFEAGAGWIEKKEVIPICHSGLNTNNLPMPLSYFQALEIDQDDFVEKLMVALSKHLGIKKQPEISSHVMKKELSNALGLIKPNQLGTIEFQSSSPGEDGWEITVDNNNQPPEFEIIDDGYWGKVLKINLQNDNFMDHPVRSAEQSAKFIEFILKNEGSWTLYSEIQVISSNRSSTRNVWLAFKVGSDDPKPFNEFEWTVYCPPEPLGGNWCKIHVNLPDAVVETFGLNGWKYKKLLRFRIRGMLTIAKIDMLS